MSSGVKVAVRVRPFNSREKEANAKLVIKMEGKTTIITDPETGKDRKFAFDYSYWSHSGAKEAPTGEHIKASPSSPYIDQEVVFQDMGLDVINNAFEGYHTCLFAYGQTGSGKSYSMVGYGADKGIVPRACEEIFSRVKTITDKPDCNVVFEVTVSMLEIYNENVQDLFQAPNNRPKGGLKVRESPTAGVFVESLNKVPVRSYEEIQRQYDVGNNNRTIASTLMNATSSRAHTIFSIVFKQRFFDPDTKKPANEKNSHMHLVDLAGSERVGDTGATGTRLLEGTNINKSLSVLGKCISILAEKSIGKKKDIVVPYRESNLTRILQNALGGNSKTCMIAAISPASICFDESLSTLRYADQVKQIKNTAIVNESPQDRLIRELKEENDKLKKKLGGGQLGEGISSEELERLRKAYEEQLEINRLAREELEKDEQNRASSSVRAVAEIEEAWKGKFHISNLNEDPLLTGKIRHVFKEGENRIGKNDKDNKPDIIIGGVGVIKGHCVIKLKDSTLTLIPNPDFNAAKVLVNGKLISEETELVHNDRILFDNTIDWDYANKETISDQLKAVTADQEGLLQQKLKELEEKYNAEKKKAAEDAQAKFEEQLKLMEEKKLEMEKEFEEKMKKLKEKGGSEEEVKQLEEEMQEKKKEAEITIKVSEEKMQKEQEEENRRQKKLKEQKEFRIRNQKELEEKLSSIIPKINEVNEMCLQLGRLSYLYTPTIVTDVIDGQMHSKVHVKIFPDHSQNSYNEVPMESFFDHYYLIQEKFQNYQYDLDHNEGPIKDDDTDDDPRIFGIEIKLDWIPIGQAHIYTDSLAHLLATTNDVTPLIDTKGNINGELKYSLIPKYIENGVEQNLVMFDSIDQLEGKMMQILLKIISARGLPTKLINEIMTRYKWIDEKGEIFTSEVIQSKTINPEFNYEKEHELFISPFVVGHIWEGALSIEVLGKMTKENTDPVKGKVKGTDNTIEKGESSFAPVPMLKKGEAPEEANQRLHNEIQMRDKRIRDLEAKLQKSSPPVSNSSGCCILF